MGAERLTGARWQSRLDIISRVSEQTSRVRLAVCLALEPIHLGSLGLTTCTRTLQAAPTIDAVLWERECCTTAATCHQAELV